MEAELVIFRCWPGNTPEDRRGLRLAFDFVMFARNYNLDSLQGFVSRALSRKVKFKEYRRAMVGLYGMDPQGIHYDIQSLSFYGIEGIYERLVAYQQQ